jgi:SAM-dependent methyltransferase
MRIFDSAFRGGSVEVRDDRGREQILEVERWAAGASMEDRGLFVARCTGPTVDLGCGPGRLVRALQDSGVEALGVDSSAEAVRLARQRGLPVLQRDLFEPLPREGRWAHALLADGNVGIGGRPLRLLRRVWTMLATGGSLHVEVERPGIGVVQGWRQLRVDGQWGPRFPWALVGADAIAELAIHAGFHHADSVVRGERRVAVLTKAATS